jgi:outer membrane protein assembly factor BamE (lipoprotein component of BamABCDE complex)
MSRSALVSLAALLLAGCTTIPNNMGFIIDTELVDGVQPGVDTKSSIARSLGRPTDISLWDDNIWYYLSRRTGQRAFLRPKPEAQNILIITFGEDEVVKSVEQRGLEKVVNVSPDGNRTPTLGRESSLFEDIFSNIGQVGGMGGAPGGMPQ